MKSRDQFYREFKEINAFYAAPEGLQRPGGMVLNNGECDAEAMGAWGYDLLAESRTVEQVKTSIRQSEEWKTKHPTDPQPSIGRILYTSLIDRTIFVLWPAIQTAAPAGAVIWLLANININQVNLAQHISNFLDPFGWLLGLHGVILLAYIIAIPANEIVVPTMLMVYMGTGMMIDLPSFDMLRKLLVEQHGWTLLTAVNLMLFSLLHNPCATTIMTIYKETRSARWATVSVVITLGTAFVVTFITASLWRLAAGG